MPRPVFRYAALLALAAEAQTLNYRGRVLDRAALQPVPGATVQAGGLTAQTDALGRFTLQGNPSALGPIIPGHPGLRREGTWLWISGREPGRFLRGNRLPGGGPRHISLTGATRSSGLSGGGTETGAATAKRAAVEVTVRKDKLLTKTLSPASAEADLGDIVLDYPPRRLGLGSPAPYGAEQFFPAEGDSASARKLLEAQWIHKLNSWRQGQGLGTTPVLWQVRPDPESAAGAYRPSLLPCCEQRNGSPGWGYDDIVTKKVFRDYQLHVEFNMMGPADGNTNTSGYCNSGLYITPSLEIQIETPKANPTDADRLHGMGTLINKRLPDRDMYPGPGKWQSYDVTWRAPRDGGPGKVTVYWNSTLVHDNQDWGSGSGTPAGLQLQNEYGSDVRYRNIWIKELDIKEPRTNFGY